MLNLDIKSKNKMVNAVKEGCYSGIRDLIPGPSGAGFVLKLAGMVLVTIAECCTDC